MHRRRLKYDAHGNIRDAYKNLSGNKRPLGTDVQMGI